MNRPIYPIPDVEILTREEILHRYPDEKTAERFNAFPYRSFKEFIVRVIGPVHVKDGHADGTLVGISPLR